MPIEAGEPGVLRRDALLSTADLDTTVTDIVVSGIVVSGIVVSGTSVSGTLLPYPSTRGTRRVFARLR